MKIRKRLQLGDHLIRLNATPFFKKSAKSMKPKLIMDILFSLDWTPVSQEEVILIYAIRNLAKEEI